MNKVFFITGGTSGVGAEAARQLSRRGDVSKVIITSRSESSAKAAISTIATKAKRPETLFDYVVMDLNDPASCSAAVASLPKVVDVAILNAGSISLKALKTLTKTGVTEAFASICIGHGIILQGLIKDKKIPDDGRIIYAAGELQMSVWLMTGLQPFPTWNIDDTETCPANPPSSSIDLRAIITGWQYYKTFMAIFVSKVARENPDLYIVSVSPGTTPTGVYDQFSQPMRTLVNLLGGVHDAETAGDRYVDAATSEDFIYLFQSGSVIMSPMSMRYLCATGPLTDNTIEFGDESFQDRVAECLRKEIAKCEL